MTDYEPPVLVFAHRLQEPPSRGKLDEQISRHRLRADDVEYFRADTVCRLIVAARELRKCVEREGKYADGLVTHARQLERLANETKQVLDEIPGSGSLRANGSHA